MEMHWLQRISKIGQVDPVQIFTNDSIDPQSIINYEARFCHLTYKNGTLATATGRNIALNGYQESTNANYPTTRVNYRFVSSDGNKNPDYDIVMTVEVKYSGVGYIEFYVT